jgi:hypothetical protein
MVCRRRAASARCAHLQPERSCYEKPTAQRLGTRWSARRTVCRYSTLRTWRAETSNGVASGCDKLLCWRPPRRYPQIDFPSARSQDRCVVHDREGWRDVATWSARNASVLQCRILLRPLLHHLKASSIGRHGARRLPSAPIRSLVGHPPPVQRKRAMGLAEGSSPVARPARGLHRKQPTSPRESRRATSLWTDAAGGFTEKPAAVRRPRARAAYARC